MVCELGSLELLEEGSSEHEFSPMTKHNEKTIKQTQGETNSIINPNTPSENIAISGSAHIHIETISIFLVWRVNSIIRAIMRIKNAGMIIATDMFSDIGIVAERFLTLEITRRRSAAEGTQSAALGGRVD